MGKLHDVYQVTMTTITPLHIGTGRTLLRDYDYVTRGGRTWVIDAAALAETLFERGAAFDAMAAGAPAADLLAANDYQPDSPLFRYVMPGEPRAESRGAEMQEQIKDGWDRPYIPGSSLKGALRTALAFIGWMERRQERNLAVNVKALGDKPKFAALPMEHQVLSSESGRAVKNRPNYDLLRALQVSDSTLDDERRLRVLNLQVIAGEKTGSPIVLEAVPKDVTFIATLTLDGYLRKKETAAELGWGNDQLIWLKNIPTVVNKFTKVRIEHERVRWQQVEGQVRSFYAQLDSWMNRIDQKSEFLLQLGWGGGWDSKTFGAILTEDEDKTTFAQIVQRYERAMIRQGKYRQGEAYPKSRRLVVNAQNAPLYPLGWLHVKMEPVG